MSSNDSTPPDDDGRTVATDSDRVEQSSPPAGDAEGGSAPEDTNGRPSPVPRSASPGTDSRWEAKGGDAETAAGADGPESGTSSTNGAPAAESAPAAAAAPAATSGSSSSAQAEGPPPWRRVPGEQPAAAEEEQDQRPTVADSLLSEAPTAFLAAPRASQEGSTAAASGTTATVTEEPADTNGRSAATGVRPSARNRPPRQALLQLKRLDPWSVLKMALALAVVLFLVWMVAAGVLYGVLGGMGVWDRLNGTYADLVTGQAQNTGSLISAGRVFLLAAVVGAINSLLFAVALTIGAFVYNVAADLVGGIEVTLSERD